MLSSFLKSAAICAVMLYGVHYIFEFGPFGILVLIILWLILSFSAGVMDHEQKQTEILDRQYADALQRFEENPSDAELRKGVVEAGRKKAQHAHSVDSTGHNDAYFTEVSVQNDIDAILHSADQSRR